MAGYFSLLTAPVSDPVSVEEVKLHGRIETDEEDGLIKTYIKAATELAENYMGRAIMQQTWINSLNTWPSEYCDSAELIRPPTSSIEEIRLYDDAGDDTTVNSDNYWLQNKREPALVVLRDNGISNVVPTRAQGGIEIQFITGYGTSKDDVPGGIRTAVMQATVDIYETRAMELTSKVKSMLDLFKIHTL